MRPVAPHTHTPSLPWQAFEITAIAKRTLLEVKLLKHFHKHENIITLLNIIRPPKPPEPFNDVYVVMDLLESDLHRIIHSKQQLSEDHWRVFMYQLCCGLKYIHSANVLHRDIKPSNLLVTSQCHLKICDFGMARGLATTPDEHSGFMTAYVATRWYRAPEVMLSFREYTKAIDVWSVGCIFAEMLGRKYVFAGTNYVNQLNLILNLLGTPSDDMIDQIGSVKAQQYLRSLKKKAAIPLSRLYPHATPAAIDFLERMLLFNPNKRMSMDEALKHPFLAKHHKPAEEPTSAPFDFEFGRQKLNTQSELKRAILQEIESYHGPAAGPMLIRHGVAGHGSAGSPVQGQPQQYQQQKQPPPPQQQQQQQQQQPMSRLQQMSQQSQQQISQQQQAHAAHQAQINASMGMLPPTASVGSSSGGGATAFPPTQHNDDQASRKRARPNPLPLGGGVSGGMGFAPMAGGAPPLQGGASHQLQQHQQLQPQVHQFVPPTPQANTAITPTHHSAIHAQMGALPVDGLDTPALDSLFAGFEGTQGVISPPMTSASAIAAISNELQDFGDDANWMGQIDQTWLAPDSALHTELQSDLEKGSANIFNFE
jgi:serine/threonine protein kinase